MNKCRECGEVREEFLLVDSLNKNNKFCNICKKCHSKKLSFAKKQENKKCSYCGTKKGLAMSKDKIKGMFKLNICISCQNKYVFSRTCRICKEDNMEKLYNSRNQFGEFTSNICICCRAVQVSKGAKGKPKSDKHKKILSKLKKGVKRSKETIGKIKLKRAKQKNTWTSSIEFKIRDFLETLDIEYIPHKLVSSIDHKYQCDIYIPRYNLIIECDGDYWHNYPHGNKIDKIRTVELESIGYIVLRIWECEIRSMTLEKFKEILVNCDGIDYGE